ncbi:GATA transcription factor [Histoplasma capsulatum H143]|uniref:GATA transcription factor n=1 Tax=Ajellomyces capsulatus (strain H143) TaxID=544712 RepID=C6HKP0_AJECH|nr:GATA transcription factor [Histoplasma capsulatum H143]
MLSEGSTPRDFSNIATTEPVRAESPAHSTRATPSRTSTPGLTRTDSQHQKRPSGDAFRPLSRASGYDTDSRRRAPPYMGRRDSTFSGYGSGDEVNEAPAPKRAKLLRADSLDKAHMNIERQPGSLRVAASTAASVRIHRPMAMNPAAARAQASNDDPVRPPTPIPRVATGATRPIRPPLSNLRRESSSASQVPYTSPYAHPPEAAVTSPEDVRYGNAIDTPFNMPSSPPVMENMYPQTSSPLLPPLPDHDSGFMSSNLDSILDDNCIGITLDEQDTSTGQVRETQANPEKENLNLPSHNIPQMRTNQNSSFPMSDSVVDATTNEPPPALPPPPRRLTGSRPSSRASIRQNSKPLAPAPISQSEAERLSRQAIPASDPVHPAQTSQQQTQPWNGPMSDFPTATTPAPIATDDVKHVAYGSINSKQCARENKWNKQPPKDKGKRQTRRTKPPAGTSTRSSRSKALASKRSESSPGPTDASSPAGEEATTPAENGNGTPAANAADAPSLCRSISRRANSEEPPKSAHKRENRWREEDARKALHRAIQSSPARNMEGRTLPFMEANLTPKPVRRSLFPPSKDGDTMKTLTDASINVIRRSPRVASKQSKLTPTREGATARVNDGLDALFVCSDTENDPLPFPGSPTPKQNKNRGVILTPTKNINPNVNSGNSTDGSKKGVVNPSPSKLIAEELERAGQEGSRLTPRAYRINNLFKDDISALQKSPGLRSFESIGGLVLDIFDSDEDSVAQTDSFYPFVPPDYETGGNWADWAAETSISPRTAESMGTAAAGQEQGNRAISSSQQLTGGHTSALPESDLLHIDPDDPVLRSLLLDPNLNFHGNLDDQSTAVDGSNIFDMSMAGLDILNAQPKGNDCAENNEAAVAGAILQETNDKTPVNDSGASNT